MDEVDQLDSKNQEVLYTMFEWPHLAKSRLVLIGKSNFMQLRVIFIVFEIASF